MPQRLNYVEGVAFCEIHDCHIVHKSVAKARALLKTTPATPSGLAAHFKKNENDAHNRCTLIIEDSPLDSQGNRTVTWAYMRGALKYLAHIETASSPRTADACQKLLNAYKIVRELKQTDVEERAHVTNAIDDLRVILQDEFEIMSESEYDGEAEEDDDEDDDEEDDNEEEMEKDTSDVTESSKKGKRRTIPGPVISSSQPTLPPPAPAEETPTAEKKKKGAANKRKKTTAKTSEASNQTKKKTARPPMTQFSVIDQSEDEEDITEITNDGENEDPDETTAEKRRRLAASRLKNENFVSPSIKGGLHCPNKNLCFLFPGTTSVFGCGRRPGTTKLREFSAMPKTRQKAITSRSYDLGYYTGTLDMDSVGEDRTASGLSYANFFFSGSMVRNFVCLGATFLIGRDDQIRLPQLEDYSDGQELRVHNTKSPEVVEIVEGLVNLIRENDKFVVDLRNSLEINRRAEFLYRREKQRKKNAKEDLMDLKAGEVMDLTT